MAIHDYDYHDHNSFEEARRTHVELDRGTILAGAFLGGALLLFFAYMFIAAPTV